MVPRLLRPDDERVRRRASNGRADELFAELDALFNAQNTSGDTEHDRIPATFLRVTVKV